MALGDSLWKHILLTGLLGRFATLSAVAFFPGEATKDETYKAKAKGMSEWVKDHPSWSRWPEPTPDDHRYSSGSSSALVFLQVVNPKPAEESK